MSDFQPDQAVKSIVTVYRKENSTGMGVLGSGGLILTAAHCLPAMPDRDQPGDHAVEVECETVGERLRFNLVVMYADVCGDIAILAERTLKGTDLRSESSAAFHAAESNLEPASIFTDERPTNEDLSIHVYTHEGQWLGGNARIISPDFPFLELTMNGKAVIKPGTSGSPVFDDQGRVIGVISMSPIDGSGNADAVWLAAALPRWALRQLSPFSTSEHKN